MASDAWEFAHKNFAMVRRDASEKSGVMQSYIEAYGYEKAAEKFCKQIILSMTALHYCTPDPEAFLKKFVEEAGK